MNNAFISIGFGNLVNTERLIAIVNADSAPARRIIQEARDTALLIDASGGRKTRAVLIMDSEHLVTSSYTCEQLQQQLISPGTVPADADGTEEV